MSYLQAAFAATCKEAEEPERWYVCLIEDRPYYGGPEEGGWWGTDRILVAYQPFQTEESARVAREAVEGLAKELEAEGRKSFGEQCLRELDWLEARGLEADWLPEPDGESSYEVVVCQTLPENVFGSRRYE